MVLSNLVMAISRFVSYFGRDFTDAVESAMRDFVFSPTRNIQSLTGLSICRVLIDTEYPRIERTKNPNDIDITSCRATSYTRYMSAVL
jgi:hypothetical protein